MRRELIANYVSDLQNSLGRLRIPVKEDELQVCYDRRDFAGMVSYTKRSLKLELGVVTALVNSGGPDVPAWIIQPDPLPLYGSPDFFKSVVTIYLRKSFLTVASFENVVMAIAHELCHVVLNATQHKLRRQEEAVDLAAMLLGYRDFYLTGYERPCQSQDILVIERFGYLTPEEIRYAAHIMTFP